MPKQPPTKTIFEKIHSALTNKGKHSLKLTIVEEEIPESENDPNKLSIINAMTQYFIDKKCVSQPRVAKIIAINYRESLVSHNYTSL